MTAIFSVILAFMLSIGSGFTQNVNICQKPHLGLKFENRSLHQVQSLENAKQQPFLRVFIKNSLLMVEFISVDPINNKKEAFINPHLWYLYAYYQNNPVTYLDPDGREEEKSIWQKLKDVAGKVMPKNMLPNTMQMEGWEQTTDEYDKKIEKAKKIVLFIGGALVIIDIATGGDSNEPFNEEQRALIDMAKKDKKKGISQKDAEAYKDLGSEADVDVRGPEAHPERKHGKKPHIHVGPINHIPVKEDKKDEK